MAATATLFFPFPKTVTPTPPLHVLPPQLPHLLPPKPLRSPPLALRRSGRIPIAAAAAVNGTFSGAGGEAEEAVAELLREHGASREDAAAIAARAPGYAAMLAEGVRELDELRLWGSWSSGGGVVGGEEGVVDMNALGFARKVYYMGRSKGDRGLVPFLESLGVKLSSAKLIASYASAASLPVLIDRVKFLRGVLFSSRGYETLIGINAKRMMEHLSIPADEAIQSTLSFYEKMEARSGGLSMLGHEDVSFPYLIESFPRLLLCSEDNHLKPLVGFFKHIGIPEAWIASIFLSFPPIILSDVEKDIKPRIHAWEKVGIECKYVGKMLSKYPWILSASIQDNYGEILALFNRYKTSKTILDVAVKSWPHILGCSTKKMNSILGQFDELGISKKMLAPVITSSPQLLLRKPNQFVQVISFFEEMGFDRITAGKILCRSPEIFAADVDKTPRKKIKFLTDFGVSKNQLPRIIRKYPEFLLLDISNTLLPRLNYLLELGLSKKEVCSMIYRFSPLLGYSVEEVMKPKLEFLLHTMRKPLKEIEVYPRYFSYSLEKKIKLRFWVLKRRNIKCSLKDMFAKNDELFAEEFMGIGRLHVTSSPSSSEDC